MGLTTAARVAILGSIVLDVPVLSHAARGVRPTHTMQTLSVAGVPVEVLRPGSPGPWPAFVFVNGAHPERRREPVVRRLTEGLARAGFIVIVPEPPGLGEGEIAPGTLEAVVEVVKAALMWPDLRGGRATLMGASTGASLALVAASHPAIAAHVSGVVAVTPYADLAKVIRLATTGSYGAPPEVAPRAVSDLLRTGIHRSLLACLRAATGPEAGDAGTREAITALLSNADPDEFDRLFGLVPLEFRAILEQLSPLACATNVRAPVEIVVPPSDEHFPLEEAFALARALADARITVAPMLDHTRPSASLRRLGAMVGFLRFVYRGLDNAGRDAHAAVTPPAGAITTRSRRR
jgi:acetyl esterase/lipase